MNWNDFTTKLKKAKDEKRIVGNVAGAFMNLIYSGAMDSLIPDGKPPALETYDGMFADLKKALGSKANKTKKKKTDMLGLADVTHNILLGTWRFQNNPISQFNLRRYATPLLETKGFKTLTQGERDIRGFMKMELDKDGDARIARKTYFVTDEWQKFFENQDLRDLFIGGKGYRESNGETEKFQLIVLGVVIDKKVTFTRGGKQRMNISLFTGKEKTGEITFWPERGETMLNKKTISDIQLLNVYAISINLSEFMGMPGANVASEGLKTGYIKVFDFAADKKKEEAAS